MGFVAASLVFVLVSMVVIGCTNADQQKPSSILSIYDSYKNMCSKIGWEPKCGKQHNSGINSHLYLYTTLEISSAFINYNNEYYNCMIKNASLHKTMFNLLILFYEYISTS